VPLKLTEACGAGTFGEVPSRNRKPRFPERKEKTMNREDLINRLVARKLQPAGNAQASYVKICYLATAKK
jgi:hypothetical protein